MESVNLKKKSAWISKSGGTKLNLLFNLIFHADFEASS